MWRPEGQVELDHQAAVRLYNHPHSRHKLFSNQGTAKEGRVVGVQYMVDTAKPYDGTFPPNDPKLERMKLAYCPVHCNSETRPGFTYLYHQPYDIAAYEPWMTHPARISKARRTNDSERLVTLYAPSEIYKPDFVEEFGKQRVEKKVFDYLEMTQVFRRERPSLSRASSKPFRVLHGAGESRGKHSVTSLGAGDSPRRVP